MRTALVVLVMLLSIAGCATTAPPPPRAQLAAAPIGPPPTDYEATIRAYFAPRLRDPYSAVYTFMRPVRAWQGDKVTWAVCAP